MNWNNWIIWFVNVSLILVYVCCTSVIAKTESTIGHPNGDPFEVNPKSFQKVMVKNFISKNFPCKKFL